MEEVKYHQKFHQAKMSHLLSIFKKSKSVMPMFFLAKLIFQQNIYSAVGIFWGYIIMIICINKLENSVISNHRSVLIMAHFITIIKVVTSITATINNNPTPPNGMQIGVVICFLLTFKAMKIIEPDYVKASIYFWSYWSIYLIALSIYYQVLLIEQLYMYTALFILVHEIYKQDYLLTNSLTEIFYDFQFDPIVFYEGEESIKVNHSFLSHFGYLIKTKKAKHHSQMLSEIGSPEKLVFIHKVNDIEEKVSLLDVINNNKKMEQTELFLKRRGVEKVFIFTSTKLVNVYDSKTAYIFKDITHSHQLQKVKSQVEFRSVIMGWLTHELRTPINCATSILKSLEEYIVDSDEARKLLAVCNWTIETLKCLTEDFIDFTRFENQKGLPVQKESVEVRSILGEIRNIFIFQAEEKELEFNLDISMYLL